MFKPRKPVNASTKQKISQALKGKRKQIGAKAQKLKKSVVNSSAYQQAKGVGTVGKVASKIGASNLLGKMGKKQTSEKLAKSANKDLDKFVTRTALNPSKNAANRRKGARKAALAIQSTMNAGNKIKSKFKK